MSPYTSFTDEQVKGDFKMMKHEHYFTIEGEGTLMTDIFTFETPYGIFGPILNSLFLEKYTRRLLEKRNQVIKDYAETNKWKDVL